MGYVCPVCEAPQADGEHLANHLAFTAMLHGDGHEAWLDERVPDWADRDPDALAAVVVEHAEETDPGTVFDDTAGGRPDVDLGHGRRGLGPGPHDAGHGNSGGHGTPRWNDDARELDPETRRIVEEARELTRRRAGEDREE